MVVAHPSAGEVGVETDVVVSGVVRGECEAAVVGSARVDDDIAVGQVLDIDVDTEVLVLAPGGRALVPEERLVVACKSAPV